MAKKVVNENKSTWIRPWNIEKFDDLYNRDERYFSILIRGALAWLSNNIVLYNKGIRHFIFNTGSSYLYVESNGYQFSMNETSGEDAIYMKMPRCVIEIGDIAVPTEELSSPYVRGQYERRDGNMIKGYNAQIRRMPIELTLTAKYVLSNFNESLVLVQELIDRLAFQQYFNITYLGQVINCSLEIDNNYQIEFNKVDMESTDTNQKNINITYKLCSNYPCIDERTEIENNHVIAKFEYDTKVINSVNISNSGKGVTISNYDSKYNPNKNKGTYDYDNYSIDSEYSDGSQYDGSNSVSVISEDVHETDVVNPDGTSPVICDYLKIDFTEENLKKRITEPEMAEKYGVDE